jgi:hypothetical protein
MTARKSSAEKIAPEKMVRPTRTVEEIYFLNYIKEKKTHKHIEEIGIEDYLNRKRPPDAS